MAEVTKYRLRAVQEGAGQGECALARTGLCLRVQLRIEGIRGRVEVWLFTPGGKPLCAQVGPALGSFACDRGMVYLEAFPESVLILCEGKPSHWAGRGDPMALWGLLREKDAPPGETRETPAMQDEVPVPEEAAAEEETGLAQAVFAPMQEEPVVNPSQGEEALTDPAQAPPERESSAEAELASPGPMGEVLTPDALPPQETAAAELASAQEPDVPAQGDEEDGGETEAAQAVFAPADEEEAPLMLPWDLSPGGMEAALTRGEAMQPFPGGMQGAKFVRIDLGGHPIVPWYVAGRIPLSDGSCYYLLGIPGAPEGAPQGAAADFNHYLPGSDGSGYWVKYMME